MLAVPGEITSALSAGTNALLRLGATPATCAADVLESFGLEPAEPEVTDLGAAAESLLERLRDGALSADELVRASGVDAAGGLGRAARAGARPAGRARGRRLPRHGLTTGP